MIGGVEAFDKGKVHDGVPGAHSMLCADCNGQSVHSGGGDELSRLLWMGCRSRRVHSAHATADSKFRLDRDTCEMTCRHDERRFRQVAPVVQQRTVEHDRSQPELDGLFNEGSGDSVIELNTDLLCSRTCELKRDNRQGGKARRDSGRSSR